MHISSQTAPVSRKKLWAGRIISALPILFLLIDGIMKLIKPPIVVTATVELGYRETVIVPLGVLLLTSTICMRFRGHPSWARSC